MSGGICPDFIVDDTYCQEKFRLLQTPRRNGSSGGRHKFSLFVINRAAAIRNAKKLRTKSLGYHYDAKYQNATRNY